MDVQKAIKIKNIHAYGIIILIRLCFDGIYFDKNISCWRRFRLGSRSKRAQYRLVIRNIIY